MTKEQRSAIFHRAAELVRAGWCQGAFRDIDGSRCLLGALIDGSECGDLIDTIGLVKREIGDNPAEWNDAPGRTQAEVVELLERLAGE